MILAKSLLRYFLLFLFPLVLVLNLTLSPKSQADPVGQMYVPYSFSANGALLPNWRVISFASFPAVSAAGSLNLSNLAGVLGYDPSRSWQEGDSITSILKLGDLSGATHLANFSLGNILGSTGLGSADLSLADFGLLNSQSLSSLVKAVPFLSAVSLGSVAPLHDLVNKYSSGLSNSLLGQIIDNPLLADLPLNQLNLKDYSLDSIPGLLDAPLGQFAQWENSFLYEIPGLANLGFLNFFDGLGNDGVFALLDVVYGPKEGYRTNTVTGSNVVGFAYPCAQSSCAHLELMPTSWLPIASLKGKQWISGNSQSVQGGSGCLAGQEPTGRLPYGPAFKVVLTNTDEASGRADFGIYFRFSIFCGDSPYFIGPFPWMSQYEKDLIFLGVS